MFRRVVIPFLYRNFPCENKIMSSRSVAEESFLKRSFRIILVAVALAALLVFGAQALAASTSGSGSTPITGGAPPAPGEPKTYYFTWYDSMPEHGMVSDSIVIGNLEDYGASALVYFGDEAAPRETISLAARDRQIVSWPDTMGGPVRVHSPDGATLVVTQRVFYGDTFNEVGAIEEKNLDTSYNFTWYDSNPDNGMVGNWILVANAGQDTALVDIFIGGNKMGSYSIPAGEKVTPNFPDLTDGPVQVVSTNGQPIIASQRVLWGGSFNEVMGTPTSGLDTIYYFTWYDMVRARGMRGNWVLVSNLSDTTVHAQVFIGQGSTPRGTYAIEPHQSATPTYPDLMDGPVRVVCTDCAADQKLMVSQRVLYRDSFEEVQGTPPAGLTEREFFGWYDFTAANDVRGNWLLIANLGTGTTTVDVYIGSSTTPLATYDIGEGDRVTPMFPELQDGPVRVSSRNDQPLMVSQRTIYRNSFNELLGLTKYDVGQPGAPGPDMRLYKLNTYWSDYADFQNHLLSVDMRVANPGQGNALGTTITGIQATQGVTPATTVPIVLGDIAAGGGYANFTVRYNVPAEVTGFQTQVSASCQDAAGVWYYYPADPPAAP